MSAKYERCTRLSGAGPWAWVNSEPASRMDAALI
jgi:hypothetical protein